MTGDEVVVVEGLWKKYCKSLKRSMVYAVSDIGRNVLGFSARPELLRPDEFWAVHDVSFSLNRGETLGVIGHNGSGKTTLLKMLNGIFPPDKGKITVRGRTGALIEVGAGFHPMLTGRENIYVNAAIMGMSRNETYRRFDEIVDFAGIGDFLDVPVKNYSSGMFVRLGFAVAIHSEPDLLLVDEVLAVGDESFRGKCYNKIAEMMGKCAVVMVSHDLPALARVSSKCIVMNHGLPQFQGNPQEAVQHYLSAVSPTKSAVVSAGVSVLDCTFAGGTQTSSGLAFEAGGSFEMRLDLDVVAPVAGGTLLVNFLTIAGEFVAEWNSDVNSVPVDLLPGSRRLSIRIDDICLNPGAYDISVVLTSSNKIEHLLWVNRGWRVVVTGSSFGNAAYQMRGQITEVAI